MLFTLAGVIVMFISSIVLFYGNHTFFYSFLTTFLEPGGWFLFWEGTDLIIFESKKAKPEEEFYKKMSEGKIIFKDY
jgi:hypothetical protein